MMKRILLSHYVSNSKHFMSFSYINKTYQEESQEEWYAKYLFSITSLPLNKSNCNIY